MKLHAHIALCNKDSILIYDNVNFNPRESVKDFLDFIFNVYNPKTLSRDNLEADMYRRVDEKSGNIIYFISGEILYLWVQCDKCHLASLN